MNDKQQREMRHMFRLDTVDGQAEVRASIAIQIMHGQYDPEREKGWMELLDSPDPVLVRRSCAMAAYLLITRWIELAVVPASLVYLGAAEMIADQLPAVADAIRTLSKEARRHGGYFRVASEKLKGSVIGALLTAARSNEKAPPIGNNETKQHE